MKHELYGFSSHVWPHCYNGTWLSKYIEPEGGWPETESSQLGTTAHAILEQCILYGVQPGEICDDIEIVEGVEVALEYIYRRVDETGGHLEVESFKQFAPDCGGTGDLVLTWGEYDHLGNPIGETGIEVMDFKFGRGVIIMPTGELLPDDVILDEGGDENDVFVMPDGNTQLLLSALTHMDGRETVVLGTIIQPRIPHVQGPVRTAVFGTGIEVLNHWDNFFRDALAKQGTGYNPGPMQCKFCKGRGACHAYADWALEKAQLTNDGDLRDVNELEMKTTRPPGMLDPDQATTIMNNVEMIRGWLKAVVAHTQDEYPKDPSKYPGLKMVQSSAGMRRIWSEDEPTMLTILTNVKGVNKADVTTTKLLGPKPVESHLKLLKRKEVISARQLKRLLGYITKPEGKTTLVSVHDARPSIVQSPEEMFSDVEPVEEK